MVTLKDIAEKANVSLGTVSRYLNNNIVIKKETEERLLKAIDELGYVPNRIAQALKENITKNIAVVFPKINNMYYSEITSGISYVLNENGYNLFLYETENMKFSEDQIINLLRENIVAGVIFIGMSYDLSFSESIKQLVEFKIPVVYMNRAIKYNGFPLIYPNYDYAATLAANHFKERGKERIAIVYENLSNHLLDKYECIFTACSINNRKPLLLNLTNRADIEKSLASTLLEEKIDGVFVSNELNAVYLTNALTRRGFCIPKDISIIGLGNSIISELSVPKLSSIDFFNAQLGEISANCILDQIKGIDVNNIKIIDPKLIVRETT